MTEIPLSSKPTTNAILMAFAGALSAVMFYLGLVHKGWVLRIYGARLDPETSQVLFVLLGCVFLLTAVNQLIKLLTVGKIRPFAVCFGNEGVTLPTAAILRGLRQTRVQWADIRDVGVNRSGYTEEVVIVTGAGKKVSLPGEFYTKEWKSHRIAEAIRQEMARRAAPA
jgi:hypothetical protein